jgi:mono/diheme cytochrome c family protein
MTERGGLSGVTLVVVCAVAVVVIGCAQDKLSPEAERGRQVYLAQCTTCHSTDPAQLGPVGPPIKNSSRELLEAKVLRGTYPPGYRPKRPTAVMPPQPQLAADIPAIAAYLK